MHCHTIRPSVALVAATLLFGTSAAASAQQTAASEAAMLSLRPGDAIKLTVWRAPELSGEFPVAPDGTLAHPAFPSLLVANVPLRRVQGMLDSAVRVENMGARVVMQPLLSVIVDGEIGRPNLYRHPAGTSVAEALVLAGGRTERSDFRRVALLRDGRTSYFDLTDPAGSATSVAVASGDRLIVRRRGSFRERVLPVTSLIGTAASIATLIIRAQR
jgi:polysaccharide export outer membrane protein